MLFRSKIMQNIPSGGGCVNDCIIHLSNLSLPFGGMGASGMGKYHGKYGYNTFSHTKGYMISQKNIDNKIKYPPYSKFDLIKKILRISK